MTTIRSSADFSNDGDKRGERVTSKVEGGEASLDALVSRDAESRMVSSRDTSMDRLSVVSDRGEAASPAPDKVRAEHEAFLDNRKFMDQVLKGEVTVDTSEDAPRPAHMGTTLRQARHIELTPEQVAARRSVNLEA